MSNAIINKNSKETNSAKILCFPSTQIKDKSESKEKNIIRFDVFMQCFYEDRPDWKGRALVLLGYIKSCLFWERMLISRKMLDKGQLSGFGSKYETLLAENDEEQCRSTFLSYLMKSVRAACALNAELHNSENVGEHFINRKIKRSDETGPYNYDLADSLKMVHDFDESFDDNWGGNESIMTMRWDLKLRA
ncbi:MAG: hypothetical protein LBI03_07550, partial [Clostridiales bacterium]|nr:hypothetical protein [Clostridiales bacterium]